MLSRHEERVERAERQIVRRGERKVDLPAQGRMGRPDGLAGEGATRHGVEHGSRVCGEQADQFPADVSGAVEETDVGALFR
jgi:hypothetical protein